MSDLPEHTGLAATIASGVAIITTGFLAIRNYLSNNSVGRAGNAAQLQVIQMLQDQVTRERARADAAISAKDEAIKEIGQLREQVAELTIQVQNMKNQLDAATRKPNGSSADNLKETVG